MKTVYLDNNATTPIDPRVVEAMTPFLTENYFNPSSHYDPARQVKEHLEKARETILSFLGDPNGQLIFTGCATESNNWVLNSALKNGRNHIITTAVEHPSVYG
ncbi:MAG: aminotransferase class V-fold PLP-dependent enzyme, partial [Pseudomonadota bacterium]